LTFIPTMRNNTMLTDGKFTNLRKLLSSLNIELLKRPVNEPVLFLGEGGLGDEIIFVRFAKVLQDKGIQCVYCSTSGISNILSRSKYFKHSFDLETETDIGYNYNTENNINNLSKFKYFISPFASYLGFEENNIFDFDQDIKWREKYLFSNKDNTIPQSNNIKIGLKFSGTPALENRYKRNFPLERVVELFDPDKFQLYSFQRDECVEQVREHQHIIDLSNHCKTLDNTLSALDQMDYVISSCTSIAHASAALDKKTFILIPNNRFTYRVWDDIGIHNEKPMIYSHNTTVIKQKDSNCWDYPFVRLKEIFNIQQTNKKVFDCEYS